MWRRRYITLSARRLRRPPSYRRVSGPVSSLKQPKPDIRRHSFSLHPGRHAAVAACLDVILRNVEIRKGYDFDATIDGGRVIELPRARPGDEQAAYDLIDAMLAPESGAYMINQYGYGHSSRKAFDLVGEERLDELGISSPEALFAQGIFFEEIPPETLKKYITMFEEVKAGF